MPLLIKKRGLYFCGNDGCILGPEIWRGTNENRRGLCAPHALAVGWIDKIPAPVQDAKPSNGKGFLSRLLENKDGALDALFPMPEVKQHWSEYREFPF